MKIIIKIIYNALFRGFLIFLEEGKVTEINSPVPSILDKFNLSAALVFASTTFLFSYALISFMSSTAVQ